MENKYEVLEVHRPSYEMIPSFIRMRDAHMAAGENEWTHRGEEIAHTDPHAFVDLMNDRAAGRRIAEGFVKADEFWIVEKGEVVGTLGVRHELTEKLRKMGGHIGYSTHPAHRGRGIATFALRHGIEVLAGLGVTEALVTCDEDNGASARVIEKCGGRRLDDFLFPGNPAIRRRRYVVATARQPASTIPSGIIIEGITGAGKSHTLRALCANVEFDAHWAPYDVFREKETFGEFMGELIEHPDDPPERKFRLLQRVLTTANDRAQRISPYRFILERAHYSYYALLPNWSLYRAFDDVLRSLNSHVFLLWIPPEELKRRSLYRADRNQWGAGFVAFHGDEAKALARFEEVQQIRYEGIKKSSVPHTVIDTSKMDWESYAAQILHGISRLKAGE